MHAANPALAEASALAPDYYTRADVYAFECREILGRTWQLVAPAGAVANPGDVIAREIGGVPIVIVRDNDGALNGFYNICPHRAGPLATCDAQSQKRLRCGYHGWVYDFSGALVSAREMEGAAGFDPASIRLKPIDVLAWHGQVYARLEDGVAFDAV